MKRFKKKVIVITGAASGIGAATAWRMTEEGGKVVIADFAKDRADVFAEELRKEGREAQSQYFDATELKSCLQLVEFAVKEYGRIDVLVNNVGGTDLQRDRDMEELDISYFEEAFQLNLRYAIYLSQLVIPIMADQGSGNIVNVASVGGITADLRGTYYGVAKAGMINLTRYIATQAGKKNIRCNAVAPGLVLTPAALNNLSEEMRNVFLRHNVLPYLGKPEDIASVIAFLASDDASYVTGQTLVADGGLIIHNPTIADLAEMAQEKRE